ncbi:MAG TPA: ArsR family transcriptional regulator [Desulfobacterales bacterium]|nr:ArsR family transcriptional regulator [Desulfobacterales bacterium]
MACVEPDGFLTRCGEFLLLAVWKPATCEAVAARAGVPLFRVRGGVRELCEAGLLEKIEEGYVITPMGMKKMEE